VRFLSSNVTTQLVPEPIVVGVLNVDRTLDMTPSVEPLDLSTPTGGAVRFRAFLTDELAPFVRSRFRTAPYSILAGHSYAGLFTVDTLVRAPASFDSYIAMDPSLWWNDGEVVAQLEEAFPELPDGRSLFLATGDLSEDPGLQEAVDRLASLLDRVGPAGLRWRFASFPDEDHGSMPHRAFYAGLEFLFQGWRPDHLAREGDVEGIVIHYADLSARLGFEVPPPWTVLSHVSVVLEERGEHDAALAARVLSTQLHPGDNLAHRDLGEALRRLGRLEEALASFEKARELVVHDSPVNHEYLLRYTRTIEDVTARLGQRGVSDCSPAKSEG
jgi:pimeloyl-ACP methyl ester carboxylesterase